MQFDNTQLKSTTPGEIDAANISISGGLIYQNNFQLDGFNMNNDLTSNYSKNDDINRGIGGATQGFRVDTSLLESIVVMDSNIGAAYGGFTGGVVEANIRKPRRDRWHFDLSYQYTSDKITTQHIHENSKVGVADNSFEKSSSHYMQPKFSKYAVKFNFEGYVTEKLGLIGGFSTIQAEIPLYSNNEDYYFEGEIPQKTQTRRTNNYFLKANYNLTDRFTLEANVAYMPEFDSYFWPAKDSHHYIKDGGWQAGLKGTWDTDLGLWVNQFGYSRLQHSMSDGKNYYLAWYPSTDKNWPSFGYNGTVSEGDPASIESFQQIFSYKSDMSFNPIGPITFRVGAELNYQDAYRALQKDYYQGRWGQNLVNLNGRACLENDNPFFGIPLCSTGVTRATSSRAAYQGQYINAMRLYEKDHPYNNSNLYALSYALYVEEYIKVLDSTKVGVINARFGVRFDGDNYMSKKVFAPRFSLAYNTPVRPEYRTQITFGANRYYARNLLSYKLNDIGLNRTKEFTRTDETSPWVEVPATNSSSYEFQKLDIPYSNELMVGISQEIGVVNLNAKYIGRRDKDELVYKRTANVPRSYYWSNEGSSKSDVISLAVQNTTPIKTANIYHHYLFAFDWTQVRRTYNIYESSVDDGSENPDIFYDGKVIKYNERPTENFARPWTIRLNTTHSWQFKQANLLWNNFFRYRSGYDKMVTLNRTTPGYDATIGSTMTQYGRHHFKGAFSWDMRIGLDFRVDTLLRKESEAGRIYINVDIVNVLNAKNEATLSNNYNYGQIPTGFVSATYGSVAYEVGRQFWIQIGYKY